MKCPKCQHENPVGAKFCNECAQELKPSPDLSPQSLSFDEKTDKIQRYLPKLTSSQCSAFNIHPVKEQFRDFWDKDSIEEDIEFLDAWCKDVEASPIIPLKKVAKSLAHHSHGLINYYYCISCGLVEGFNNKIKTLKRQA